MRLIFLENRDQVAAIQDELDDESAFVPITAEALDALEELGLPCQPVSKFTRPGLWSSAERDVTVASVRMLGEIERYVAEHYPPARFDGPGFLSGQDYNVQFSIIHLATRGFLMREAIRALRPTSVAAFVDSAEPWFAGDGNADRSEEHTSELQSLRHL